MSDSTNKTDRIDNLGNAWNGSTNDALTRISALEARVFALEAFIRPLMSSGAIIVGENTDGA